MERTTPCNSTLSIPKILAQEYFSKPMHALARSYDLAAYDLVKLDIKGPALDLGCGNGAFGSVFCQIKGLDGLDLGMDLGPRNVRLASRRGSYKIVFQSDARSLPIRTAKIKFILCNGVLCCICPGHDLALLEVARVLETGGQFVMTVPTPNFAADLLLTRLFEHLGLHMLATLYSRRVNARNGIRKSGDLELWRKELERVGLKVEGYVHYFGGSEATWWGVLAMRPFQLFAILRYLPEFIQRLAATLTESLIRFVPRPIHPEEKNCVFLLIVARKV